MSDAALRELAARAGIAVEWTDAAGEARTVALGTLRHMLTALDLPCRTAGDVAESSTRVAGRERQAPSRLIGVRNRPIPLDFAASATAAKLHLENGRTRDLKLNGAVPPISETGYHHIEFGDRRIPVAVAPERCFTVADISPEGRLWGMAVQVYGLRRAGDGGIGDFGGVAEAARLIASYGADVLAMSPIHALFGARPERFAPYSPSSRIFLNPLHADPALVLGEGPVRQARARSMRRGATAALIDWPARAGEKLALFRALFAALPPVGLLADDLARFRQEKGESLARHAAFETNQASAADKAGEIRFQIFLQWLAARSLAGAQRLARDAGMRVGLVTDLAVGVDPGGSDAVGRPSDMLTGLRIGAPPDLFNPRGQNWGLTALSPRAFAASGYAPFIDLLRAGMAHAGGIRIDHAMGLRRLWLIPDGARPGDGAYLTYPFETLLQLIALESARHRAIVIAEDLGTVPPGFSDRLNQAGILGMRVLWFERDKDRFKRPAEWEREAIAMSSTHDLPPVAGWWRGADIRTKATLGFYDTDREGTDARMQRGRDRSEFWQALTESGCAQGKKPDARETNRVTDGAICFVARTPSRLTLFPLEDMIGEKAQPNLPGTLTEHPNWRRRQKVGTAKLLAAPRVAARLSALKTERR